MDLKLFTCLIWFCFSLKWRLTFIKSYAKGHTMSPVKHGLMSGDELVEYFSTSHSSTKVFFVLDSRPGDLKLNWDHDICRAAGFDLCRKKWRLVHLTIVVSTHKPFLNTILFTGQTLTLLIILILYLHLHCITLYCSYLHYLYKHYLQYI